MKVSIIIPVVREDRIISLCELIKENAGVSSDQYEIVVEYDNKGIGCPRMVAGLVKKAKYDWIMFLGDDTEPQPDFLKNAIEKAKEFETGFGLVALNDGIHNGTLATHWLAHRSVADLNEGYFFHTEYSHLYCDRELTDITVDAGVYAYSSNAVIKHNHPENGKESDRFYDKVYAKESWRQDRKTYIERRARRTGVDIKLAVCVPITYDLVDKNFWKTTWQMQLPPGTDLITPHYSAHPGDIAKVRNDMVRRAIDKTCTHVLFIDSDQVYHNTDLIERLLSHGKDIVGGKVHRRYPPYEPILRREGQMVPYEEVKAGGLVEVDTTGTGCLLINVDVFFDIDWPWFETIRDERMEVTCGEDVSFCRKATKAGYKIYVDCDVDIDHLATLAVNGPTYEAFNYLQGVRQ